MMAFIMMTISFTVAILLAIGLSFMIMTSPKVLKLYVKHVFKTMNILDKSLEELEAKDL